MWCCVHKRILIFECVGEAGGGVGSMHMETPAVVINVALSVAAAAQDGWWGLLLPRYF